MPKVSPITSARSAMKIDSRAKESGAIGRQTKQLYVSRADSVITKLILDHDISVDQACDIVEAVEEIDWSDRQERTSAWRLLKRIMGDKHQLEQVFLVLKQELAPRK